MNAVALGIESMPTELKSADAYTNYYESNPLPGEKPRDRGMGLIIILAVGIPFWGAMAYGAIEWLSK